MNKTQLFGTLCVLLVSAAVGTAAAAEGDIGAASVKYKRACAVCHGPNGHGGRGPDLVSGRWAHGGTDADIYRTVVNGIPGTDMPAFGGGGRGGRFNEEDIKAIVAHVRSLANKATPIKVTGNVQRGEALYFGKGNCTTCHMIGGRGGRLGPDLSRVGGQRSPASLKESMLQPGAIIVSNYEGVRITKGGRTVQGVIKNEDNFTIQVFDGNAFHSFDRDGVDRLEEMKDSLMPAYTSLSAAEIDDLVAYLDSLRGKR